MTLMINFFDQTYDIETMGLIFGSNSETNGIS